MKWVVEYYEQAGTTQPAEAFEDSLKRHHQKLGAKLRAIAAAQALDHWRDYQETHQVSPELPEQEVQS